MLIQSFGDINGVTNVEKKLLCAAKTSDDIHVIHNSAEKVRGQSSFQLFG